MPDDLSGNHSLPSGYRATTGELIQASQHNPPLEDLSASMSARLSRDGRGGMRSNLAMGGFKVTGAGAAVASDDLVTLGQLDAALAPLAGVPPGSVQTFAGATLPSGWLWCDGTAVSRATYAALFAAIGTVWGAGDGSTTFNLPDASGRFPRFLPRTGGLDPGRVLGTLQADDLEFHTHTASSVVTDPGHAHTIAGAAPATAAAGVIAAGAGLTSTGAAVTGITVATTVAATGGTETRPVNIAFNAIIKT